MQQIVPFANDLGYSSMKAFIDNQSYKVPSNMAVLRTQDMFAPVTFNSQQDKDDYFQHLIEHMDVSVASPAVKQTGRFLIGQSALNAHLHLNGFDVNSYGGKSKTDLAMILTLGFLANICVKNAYFNHEPIENQTLQMNVQMATALPVMEGKTRGVIDTYKARYLNNDHIVELHNFEYSVKVKIHFVDVQVALEGEAAQFKLKYINSDLSQLIANDFANNYPDLVQQGIDPHNFSDAENFMGIDIGEGTTDLIVFTNGRVNEHVSTSLKQGFGNALEDAISELQRNGFNIDNRAALQDLINRPADKTGLGIMKQNRAKMAVRDQLNNLADAIVEETSKTLRQGSTGIDLIYVYGGGSVPMQLSNLRDQLREKTREFNAGMEIPIVWIDPQYAQYLNEAGLKVILDRMNNN